MKKLAVVALCLGLVILGVYLDVMLYDECRAHGFSTFYCLSHGGGR